MSSPIYIALIHYPVLNKHGEIVTTSITNFDLHDLARTSRTYGVNKCFIVTPNEAQQGMMDYITRHWREGYGSQYNPDRMKAFETLERTESLDQTCLTIKNIHGTSPRLVATTARKAKKSISFKWLRQQVRSTNAPFLLLFGTGWGMAPEVLSRADWVLEPIRGTASYNHLPVRAAVAIVLDRLVGE